MNLMSHLIAGFPDAETSIAIADALVKGGANILEIQLAFSDPSADGPAIQTASTIALDKGYSTKQGLERLYAGHRKLRQDVQGRRCFGLHHSGPAF